MDIFFLNTQNKDSFISPKQHFAALYIRENRICSFGFLCHEHITGYKTSSFKNEKIHAEPEKSHFLVYFNRPYFESLIYFTSAFCMLRKKSSVNLFLKHTYYLDIQLQIRNCFQRSHILNI